MDDLTLFAKTESQIDSLMQTICICYKGIGMEFGIAKCAVLTLEKRKEKRKSWDWPSNRNSISDLKESGYKYLSVLELDSTVDRKMKEAVKNLSYYWSLSSIVVIWPWR